MMARSTIPASNNDSNKKIVARLGLHRIQTKKVAFIDSFRRQQRHLYTRHIVEYATY